MPHSVLDGVHLSRDFLPSPQLAAVLAALDNLSTSWTPSQTLLALGRGRTDQVSGASFVSQTALDQIRRVLAPAVLRQARACRFDLPAAPHLQLFPVRMIGDPQSPAYQEPHHDTLSGSLRPPVCTSVFYAKLEGVIGGRLAVTPTGRPDSTDALAVPPAVNLLASFGGERVHWVERLYEGERVSIVVNLY